LARRGEIPTVEVTMLKDRKKRSKVKILPRSCSGGK